ncbi:YcaO-like family protein [Streptomyces sp. HNM0574]|uniref:YcaO-like family protein n=1 Tax=Streptomyces sp. HNM0574 TaxID=2714954 RepID=UPI00146EBA6A|nr:YcaO-like family protein [Streptomyces sp. HNM0574]NLU69586.1 YcaO-like family protein [Streptomyces sp. HNM0574]
MPHTPSPSGLRTSAPPPGPLAGLQSGERGVGIDDAREHGAAAVEALGLTAPVEPVPASRPGSWRCTLHRDGAPVPLGVGLGKGPEEAARVGAVFEALEHHLSAQLPAPDQLLLRTAHALLRTDDGRPPTDGPRTADAPEAAETPLAGDAALALLAEGPDAPLACLPYRPAATTLGGPGATDAGGPVRAFPLFLSAPGYPGPEHAAARAELGDLYDYSAVSRYTSNSGWAAGTTPAEAAVHALNETIERDAVSLLLAGQFLADDPAPLRVVDPASLPPGLAALHADAESRIGRRVHLLDMTTDLGVPAFWAYATPPTPGRPPRTRGCGASLSPRYAAERALTELVQSHSLSLDEAPAPEPDCVRTTPYPALHRCYLADFASRLPSATLLDFAEAGVPGPVFTDPAFAEAAPSAAVPADDPVLPAPALRAPGTGRRPVPRTPEAHLCTLLRRLAARGFRAWAWERYVSEHLAVVHVVVPGLERFLLVLDGHVVLPGARGRAARTARAAAPVPVPAAVGDGTGR